MADGGWGCYLKCAKNTTNGEGSKVLGQSSLALPTPAIRDYSDKNGTGTEKGVIEQDRLKH
jgi:hypothetical protein